MSPNPSQKQSANVQSFWERVYIAGMDQAHRDRTPEVPWSIRAGEIADNAVRRWRERFDLDYIEELRLEAEGNTDAT